MQKGLLCSLTDDLAQFEVECSDFDLDEEEKERRIIRDLDSAGDLDSGTSLDYKANKQNGSIITVIGVVILLFTLLYTASAIIIIPFGAILYGIRMYTRGVEQEKILEREKGEDSK